MFGVDGEIIRPNKDEFDISDPEFRKKEVEKFNQVLRSDLYNKIVNGVEEDPESKNDVLKRRIKELNTPVSELIDPEENGYNGLIHTIGKTCTLVEMLNLDQRIFFNNYAIASYKLVKKFNREHDYIFVQEFEQMPISEVFYTRIDHITFQTKLEEMSIKNFADLLSLTEEEFNNIYVEGYEDIKEDLLYYIKYHNLAFLNSKPLVSLSEVTEFNIPYIYKSKKKNIRFDREGELSYIKLKISKLRNLNPVTNKDFLTEYNNILEDLENLLEEYTNKNNNFTRKRSDNI